MGRAFRVVKRTAHLTVKVGERPEKVPAISTPSGEEQKRPRRAGAKPKKKTEPRAKRATA
jgi:hypothetical protein